MRAGCGGPKEVEAILFSPLAVDSIGNWSGILMSSGSRQNVFGAA